MVQIESSRELGTGLLPLTGRGIQRTEATVAVGDKWAHAEFVGQGEGLAVAGFSPLAFWKFAPRCNRTKEPQGIGLVAAFLVCTGERLRLLGEGVRVLQAASQHVCFPQGKTTERLRVDVCRCCALRHGLREQGYR